MRVMSIKVTHLGLDYGKVEVRRINGMTEEYEVPLQLATDLQQYHAEISRAAHEVLEAVQRIERKVKGEA